MTRQSGYIVKTKDGKLGRTFHGKGIINGKIPVYLATEVLPIETKDGKKFEFPAAFSDKAVLCDPKSLQSFGMID